MMMKFADSIKDNLNKLQSSLSKNLDNLDKIFTINNGVKTVKTVNNSSKYGACFPKDTSALLADMKKIGTPCGVLEATKKERDIMRSD